MTDPNAPTPGTENRIDYDAIEKLAKECAEDRAVRGYRHMPPTWGRP